MNQEEIGKFIKDIRIKNKLTQESFAESLHITAQAVSKWETGKSIPDISLLKEISQKYNVEIDEILNGQKKKRNKLTIIITAIVILLLTGILLFTLLNKNNSNYKFGDLTSLCDEFKIAGIAAYDAKKSSIYISNIEYCGEENIGEIYDSINCTLYENYNDITKRISTCEEKNNITLNEYLKTISIKVENYDAVCKDFDSSIIYLEINAKGKDIYQHQIPLKITTCE